MKFDCAHEKFMLAVGSMAMSPDSIKNRVAEAYRVHLVDLKPTDLPEKIQSEFISFTGEFTDTTASEAEIALPAIAKMTQDAAVAAAKKIVEMNEVIDHERGNG